MCQVLQEKICQICITWVNIKQDPKPVNNSTSKNYQTIKIRFNSLPGRTVGLAPDNTLIKANSVNRPNSRAKNQVPGLPGRE